MVDKKYTGMNVETTTWEDEGEQCSVVTVIDEKGQKVYKSEICPDHYSFYEAEKDGLTDVWSHTDRETGEVAKGYTDKYGVTHTEEYEKGKLKALALRFEDKNGITHSEDYDGKGRRLKSILEYTDEKGVKRSEEYDAKGKLMESTLLYKDENGTSYFEVYDDKGKLRSHSTWKRSDTREHEEATDFFDKKGRLSGRHLNRNDKQVDFDMNRGKISAALSYIDPARRLRGGRMGKVSEFSVSQERADINKRLKAILKDASLPGEEKKTKRREIVAEYRSRKYAPKAPNAKVGEALKKYLPPKAQESR